MRGGVPLSARLVGVAAAAVAAAVGPALETRKIYGAENIRRHLQRQKRTYDARGGWPAGYPHKSEREIARRLRQAERDRANREARGIAGVMGFSRSGLTCYAYAEGKVFRGRRVVDA